MQAAPDQTIFNFGRNGRRTLLAAVRKILAAHGRARSTRDGHSSNPSRDGSLSRRTECRCPRAVAGYARSRPHTSLSVPNSICRRAAREQPARLLSLRKRGTGGHGRGRREERRPRLSGDRVAGVRPGQARRPVTPPPARNSRRACAAARELSRGRRGSPVVRRRSWQLTGPRGLRSRQGIGVSHGNVRGPQPAP